MRIALAGLGSAAVRGHLPAIARTSGLTLVAVAEADPGRRAARKIPGVRVFADTASMLDQVEVEVLAVATATDSHTPLTVAGASRGLHVVCEKPLATRRDDHAAVAGAFAAATTSGLVTVHQYRWSPEWAKVVRWGRAADRLRRAFTLTVEVDRDGTDRNAASAWRDDLGVSGGLLGDHGVHFLALARAISEDLDVLGATRSFGPGGESVDASLRVGHGRLNLRLTTAADRRRTSVCIDAAGVGRCWHGACSDIVVGGRRVRRAHVPALSDRAHVDVLYGAFYADVVAGIARAGWRERRTTESLAVGEILVSLLEAAR